MKAGGRGWVVRRWPRYTADGNAGERTDRIDFFESPLVCGKTSVPIRSGPDGGIGFEPIQEAGIGCGKGMASQRGLIHPGQFRAFDGTGFRTGGSRAEVKTEPDGFVRVVMDDFLVEFTDLDGEIDFLNEFPLQGGLPVFTRLQFPTGEFPEPGEGFAGGSTRDEQAAGMEDQRCGDVDHAGNRF